METSLYIHIPFCKRKCLYCDFYSGIYDNRLAENYIDILSLELDSLDNRFSSIYIGGGTPTVLGTDLLRRLFLKISRHVACGAEYTLEANPESLCRDRIKMARDYGINRLSIGVQSLDDKKLKKLGRLHDSKKARDAIYFAARNGFDNMSADLIFGVWGEEEGTWRKELKEIAGFPVSHISCYSLSYEKGTPLYFSVKNKTVVPLEDHRTASMYETAVDILSLGGYKRYEISNFAKDSFECRHNMNYWRNGPYLGLGPSAVSYIDGERRKNAADVKGYIDARIAGTAHYDSIEKLSPVRRAKETAALKIRTAEGVDFKWFKEYTGYDFMGLEKKALKKLMEDGLVKYKKENGVVTGVCLKRKGFLFCDTVSSFFL